jgi:hypothetical protein
VQRPGRRSLLDIDDTGKVCFGEKALFYQTLCESHISPLSAVTTAGLKPGNREDEAIMPDWPLLRNRIPGRISRITVAKPVVYGVGYRKDEDRGGSLTPV